MHVDRLEKLATFLETVDPARFDYTQWFSDSYSEESTCANLNPLEHKCGSLGCAMGWASTIPEFQALGLRSAGDTVYFNGRYGFGAAEKFFGLEYDEANFLFCPDVSSSSASFDWRSPGDDSTPAEVAGHIRSFLSVKNDLKQYE